MPTGSGLNFTTTPIMGMRLPVPGVTGALGVEPPGTSWMELQGAAFFVLDQHTHAPGYGARVPSSGIGINADLPFNSYSATGLRSTKFSAVSLGSLSLSDVGSLVVSGVDLYFVDGTGTQIRVTASGALNGTPGSITGLIAPATATYTPSSKLFAFASAPGFVAGVSCGPLVLGDANTSGGKAVTLQAPTGLVSNYAVTLPSALPGSNALLSLSTAGVLSAFGVVSGSNLTLAGSLSAAGSVTGSLGVVGVGSGGSPGVSGTGSASGSIGGTFTGTLGSSGVLGTGQGFGAGVQGQGGASGSGGYFTGGASGGHGLEAIAGSGGSAIRCTGGVLDMGSQKITSLATPSASTEAATKGYIDSNFAALTGAVFSTTSGDAVIGRVTGGGNGTAGTFRTNLGTGYGLICGGNSTLAPFRVEPLPFAPSSVAEGDVYYDSSTHKLRVWDGTAWANLN